MTTSPFVIVAQPLEGGRIDDDVDLSNDERHHLSTVLRRRSGDPVAVADGSGWSAEAIYLGDRVRLVDDAALTAPLRPALHVVQALPKGRKLDDVVRVLTELDVDVIRLVTSEHSVVRWDQQRSASILSRLNAVAHAAASQCRRTYLPRIEAPVAPSELDLTAAAFAVADPSAHDEPAETLLRWAQRVAQTSSVEQVVVAVGPEGGWSMAELEGFRQAQASIVGLGRTLLRTEHAAAAAVAVVSAAIGRW